MRKKYTLISLLVGMALILAACASGADEDNQTPGAFDQTPAVTSETGGLATETAVSLSTPSGTETLEATPMATELATSTVEVTQSVTGTQGLPGTGTGKYTNIEDFGLVCNNLADFKVYSKDNQEIGDVEDLVVNVRSGRIMWLVVDADGGKVLVPWGTVSIAPVTTTTADGPVNELHLSVDMDAFKNAPKVEGDDFLKDANEGWDASFMTYWKDFVTSTPGGTDTTGTGSQGYTPASVMNFGLACKDFADFNIVDKNGEKVGEVDDLVVDVKGSQIAYLVVDMENSDNMVLVPFSAVSIVKGKGVNLLGGAKNDFQLTVDTDTFNSAPTFTDYTEFNTFTSGWDEQLKTYWKDFIHTTPVNP